MIAVVLRESELQAYKYLRKKERNVNRMVIDDYLSIRMYAIRIDSI